MVLTGAASRKALLKIIWLNCFSCERRAVKGVRTRAHVRRAVVELFLMVLSYPSEAPFQQQRAGQAAGPTQDRCMWFNSGSLRRVRWIAFKSYTLRTLQLARQQPRTSINNNTHTTQQTTLQQTPQPAIHLTVAA